MARFLLARVPEKSDVYVTDKYGNPVPWAAADWLMDAKELATCETMFDSYLHPAWLHVINSAKTFEIESKDNEEVEGEWRVPDA